MPEVLGQGTTFNLPNFVGELFAVTPTDTPFLSLIGGLTGGEAANATLFQWQGYDLRSPDEDRQRLEGAAAPSGSARTRFNVNNVVEIHQEAVEVSYSKMAATGQFSSTGSNHPHQAGLAGSNPVLNEMDWQVDKELIQIARDVEKSFIVGEFANPATNASPRKTRGIMEATETNVADASTLIGTATIEADNETFTLAAHGLANGDAVVATAITGGAVGVLKTNTLYYVTNSATNTFTLAEKPSGTTIAFATDGGADISEAAALTETMVLDLLQDVWTAGGIQVGETATLMQNATLKRALTKIFITDKGYEEQSRNIAGVRATMIETDFGMLNLLLNRHMPSGALQVVSAEECAPRFLPIPGKGFLFVEPLSKEGSSEKNQIYGEIGLKYGNEKAHGKLLGVKRG